MKRKVKNGMHAATLLLLSVLVIVFCVACKETPSSNSAGLTINVSSLYMEQYERQVLSVTGSDSSAYQWTTSDSGVCTVEEGVVFGVAPGQATVTVSDENGNQAVCSITVEKASKIPAIHTYSKSVGLRIGDSLPLSARMVFDGEEVDTSFTYTVENTAVATCAEGVVTGVGLGKTSITVTGQFYDLQISTSVDVYVSNGLAVSNSQTNVDLVVAPANGLQTTVALSAEVTKFGETIENVTVQWKSEDEAVAVVSQDGTVTAVGPGTTRVLAIYEDTECGAIFGHTTITVGKAEIDTNVVYMVDKMDPATHTIVYKGEVPESLMVNGTEVLEEDGVLKSEFLASGKMVYSARLETSQYIYKVGIRLFQQYEDVISGIKNDLEDYVHYGYELSENVSGVYVQSTDQGTNEWEGRVTFHQARNAKELTGEYDGAEFIVYVPQNYGEMMVLLGSGSSAKYLSMNDSCINIYDLQGNKTAFGKGKWMVIKLDLKAVTQKYDFGTASFRLALCTKSSGATRMYVARARLYSSQYYKVTAPIQNDIYILEMLKSTVSFNNYTPVVNAAYVIDETGTRYTENITYTTADENLVKVDSEGSITPLGGSGKTQVFAHYKNGEVALSYSCDVNSNLLPYYVDYPELSENLYIWDTNDGTGKISVVNSGLPEGTPIDEAVRFADLNSKVGKRMQFTLNYDLSRYFEFVTYVNKTATKFNLSTADGLYREIDMGSSYIMIPYYIETESGKKQFIQNGGWSEHIWSSEGVASTMFAAAYSDKLDLDTGRVKINEWAYLRMPLTYFKLLAEGKGDCYWSIKCDTAFQNDLFKNIYLGVPEVVIKKVQNPSNVNLLLENKDLTYSYTVTDQEGNTVATGTSTGSGKHSLKTGNYTVTYSDILGPINDETSELKVQLVTESYSSYLNVIRPIAKPESSVSYVKDETQNWYNYTVGTTGNEWTNRVEMVNKSNSDQLTYRYTSAEYVVYLPKGTTGLMMVQINGVYLALNDPNVTVYDAVTGEKIEINNVYTPVGRWLRVVVDVKGVIDAPVLNSSNCFRVALTYKNAFTPVTMYVASARMINPYAYSYKAPEVTAIDPAEDMPDHVDLTAGVGTTDIQYSTYEKDAIYPWCNHKTSGGSSVSWYNLIRFINAENVNSMNSAYPDIEFVVRLMPGYTGKLQFMLNKDYISLANENIFVYDAVTGEQVQVSEDGKVPVGQWLRIVVHAANMLNANQVSAGNCMRIALVHDGPSGAVTMNLARAWAIDAACYNYEAPEAINYVLPDYLDFTSVLGKTDTAGQYSLDESNEYYNYTATSGNEWSTRVEFANAVQTAQMGEKYTHVEFVVQLPEKYTARLQVYVQSQYCYLNNENIKVYDAATGEEISVGSDGKVPTGKWLRIVADIEGILGAPITAKNCWRISLTHKGNSTTTVTKVAHVYAIDPTNYTYVKPEYIKPEQPKFLELTAKGTTTQYSTYVKNETYDWYDHTTSGLTGLGANNYVDFIDAETADKMGSVYTNMEFVVYLNKGYNGTLQAYLTGGRMRMMNHANIKVYDAITNEQIAVGSDGMLPNEKWLRVVLDVASLMGTTELDSSVLDLVGLTNHSGLGVVSMRVARVLAVDPSRYAYEAPEAINVLPDYLDFTSVLGKTDTAGQYLLDASNKYYNFIATSGNEWSTRLEFANATQAAQMGEKYTHVEFVVQLPAEYAARLQVYVSSKYCYLYNENIKVYDAATEEEISVESDGKVPTGKWLRIVADIEGILGAPITAQNCWRIALTHKGNNTTTVTKVARVLAVDPLNYVYEAPEAINYVLPDYLDFTSVLGKTDTAGQYLLDESGEYYNYIAASENEWLNRVEFANATQAAQMGEKYTHVEFVVQLPEQYAARLQVYVSSKYYYLNNENIKVYDAATGEEISVESDGKVPTGKWLRIVADIKGLLGAPITAQNCWRISLTHKGNSTTTVTKVAHVYAIDPSRYVYEIPELITG